MPKEIRANMAEARAAGEEGSQKVSGVGIIYDLWVEIWPGYKERVKRGAVKNATTVKSFFNHDPSQVLSTLESDPSLELKDGTEGLEYTSPIPDTSYGRDLVVNLKCGNVRGASFAFSIPKGGDWWYEDGDGVVHRDIRELILYEIGPVTDPAYVQTSATLRSAKACVEEWRKSQVPVARLLRQRRQKLARLTE